MSPLLHPSERIWCAALGFVLVLGACAEPDRTDLPTTSTAPALAMSASNCAATNPPGPGIGQGATREGELFGSFFENEARACGEWTISLVPADGHPGLSPFDSTLMATSAYPIMWEYWDIDSVASNACSTNGRDAEQHGEVHPQERHCVRPGPYVYTGPGRSGPRVIPVDYLGSKSGVWPVSYSGAGSFSAVDIAAEDSEIALANYADLVINTDLGTATYAETPVLEIDATTAPVSAAFADQASPVGDTATTFRFVVGASSTTWDANDGDGGVGSRGRLLARLYYRQGTSGSFEPFTRYYDITNGENQWLRRRKFVPQGVCTDSVTFTIGLELLRPDESPDATPQPSTASGAQRTIRVACPASAPAPTAPSAVDVEDITSSSATVVWLSGTQPSGTTVTVQRRLPAGSWSTIASSLALTTGSLPMTGLSPATDYEVRVGHVLGSVTEWSSAVPFSTDTVSFSLDAFAVQSCSRTFSLDKWRIQHLLAWTITGSPNGATWEVAEGASNDPASASVVASGTFGTAWETGQYLEYQGPLYSYFWVRYVGLTGWMPLTVNPLEVTACGAN